jgi:hypothetical protein
VSYALTGNRIHSRVPTPRCLVLIFTPLSHTATHSLTLVCPHHVRASRTKKEDLTPFINVFNLFDGVLERNAGKKPDDRYQFTPPPCFVVSSA